MKKKLLPIIVLASVLGMSTLVGCNQGGSTPTPEPGPVEPTEVKVTGVSLNKTEVSLEVGGTETLVATVAPSDATNKKVTWSSSDESVVAVAGGVLTAKKAGRAEITVKTEDGDFTAKATVTVTEPAPVEVKVTGVTLNKTEVNLFKGGSETLVATVAPADATNKEVTWKSNNTDVVTVADGVLTAVEFGEADVTVKTADGGKTATAHVTVTLDVQTVSIDNKDDFAEFFVGSNKALSISIDPAANVDSLISAGYLKITSSDAEVVSVEAKKLYANKVGTATITVELFGKTDTLALEVTEEPLPDIRIATELSEEKEYFLSMIPSNGKYAFGTGAMSGYYLESKPEIAAAAVAKVKVNTEATTDYKYEIYFELPTEGSEEKTIMTIGSFDSGDHINIGLVEDPKAQYAYAKALFKFNADFSLSTMISEKEYFMGTYGGYQTFSYRAADQIEYRARLYEAGERVNIEEITISEASVNLRVDETYQIKASAKPVNADPIFTYSTSDETIATVSKNGLVTAKKLGTATITIASGEVTKDLTVTVDREALNYGTEEAPLSVVEAKALLDELDGAETSKEVYVSGIVSSAEWSDKHSNWTIWLYDGGEAHGFELYATLLADGINKEQLLEGAFVKAHGYAKIFKGTYELTNTQSGSKPQLYSLEYSETPDLFAVALNAKTKSLAVDEVFELVASPVPLKATLGDVEWASSAEAVATVDNTGKVTAVAEGEATITATAGELTAACVVTVTAVEINYGTKEAPLTVAEALVIGNALSNGSFSDEQVFVKGVVRDETGVFRNTYFGNWSIVNDEDSIFVVNSTNNVKTPIEGDEVILKGFLTKEEDTVKFLKQQIGEDKNYPQIVEVTKEVEVPLTAITLDKSTLPLDLVENTSYKLTPSTNHERAQLGEVAWESSAPEVATVDENGLVTAVAAGTAEITIKSVANPEIFAKCTVTVTAEEEKPDPYVLDGTVNGTGNGYANFNTAAQNDVTWKINGNLEQNPWRIGGKSLDGVDRVIYSETSMSGNYDKIEIAFGDVNGLTVNSLKVMVYSSAAGAAAGGEDDLVASFEPEFAGANKTVTVNKEGTESWANCYYRIVVNVTVSVTSNKYVQLKSITFSAKDEA